MWEEQGMNGCRKKERKKERKHYDRKEGEVVTRVERWKDRDGEREKRG
jgi:hypothetical protein